MDTERPDDFNAIHSYFIGPKGANLPDFRTNINTILDELLEARQNYYPDDRRFISKEIRRSPKFLEVRHNLSLAVQKVAQLLGEHSAPFWSPRYQAHMCTDLTMSSLLGYFMTMLYNPNNVALEASPMTTLVELRVGKQLCKLFGYKTEEPEPAIDTTTADPVGWGHVTCDGTVANLESIWVARNLKFYPLSLFLAVTEGKLKFIANEFKVKSCKKSEPEKLFSKMEAWELLNLRPETVLDLPKSLYETFGITGEFLESAMTESNIQTVGRNELEEKFNIKKSMKYYVAKTRHYSWPKGAAIAGLGSKNMVGIEVDFSARIDMKLLEENLLDCANNHTAVYAVVAVIGSTEEGAVDRLSKIVELRAKMQNEHGLSFLIHADAAWGGYFATMLSRNVPGGAVTKPVDNDGSIKKPEPEQYLDPETREDLTALENTDSITVDPHKAGYIPYPAGSLVYRDGRMRHLVTWSSPYLSQGSAENIGIYGVEGSKPGASAMSAWFSNQTIGLHSSGYGALLGEATFTSARLSAYYATLETDHFVCVPFNMLPSESGGQRQYFSDTEVKKERDQIRNLIIGKSDREIFNSPEAMELICKLGSDTNINAFTLNWKHDDGTLNTDVEEANYFMKNIVDRLSITKADTSPTDIPLFLTSTKFSHDDYGKCVAKFMWRMGLDASTHGLFVLRNVVMSPFPTHMNFIDELMNSFQSVVKEEVERCRKRNKADKYRIEFRVDGNPTDSEVSLVFQTSFHTATRRQQIILSAELDETLQKAFKALKNEGTDKLAILESVESLSIEEVVEQISGSQPCNFQAKISEGEKKQDAETLAEPGTVTLKSVIKSRPLNTANQDNNYPADFMPFYLYGTQNDMHMTHMLVRGPNADLSASGLAFSPPLSEHALSLLPKGLVLALTDFSEESVQPLPATNKSVKENFFFRKGRTFKVKVWEDPKDAKAKGPGLLDNFPESLYTGQLTLAGTVAVDVEGPNEDSFKHEEFTKAGWQDELDTIGEMLSGEYGAQMPRPRF